MHSSTLPKLKYHYPDYHKLPGYLVITISQQALLLKTQTSKACKCNLQLALYTRTSTEKPCPLQTLSYLENQQHTIPFSYQRISSWLIQNNSFQGGGGVRAIFVNQMSFFKKGNFLKSKYMSSNEKQMISLTLPTCNAILKGTKRYFVYHPLKTNQNQNFPTSMRLQTPDTAATAHPSPYFNNNNKIISIIQWLLTTTQYFQRFNNEEFHIMLKEKEEHFEISFWNILFW